MLRATASADVLLTSFFQSSSVFILVNQNSICQMHLMVHPAKLLQLHSHNNFYETELRNSI